MATPTPGRVAGLLAALLMLTPLALTGAPAPDPVTADAGAGQDLGLTPAERRWLEAHPHIRLGIDPAWAPFEFIDSKGRYRGMAAEYIAHLSHMLGVRMEPVAGLSWSQVIKAARTGGIDVLPCVVDTPQRREFLDFTQVYLDFPMVIVTRDDASFLSGLKDLRGGKVGVVKGYATVDLLRLNHPELELIEFETLDDGLRSLSLGGIAAFVDNLATIVTGIKRSNITNVKVAAQTPFSFKLSIGVRKDWPELVSILDKALNSIRHEQIDEIHSNWIRITFEHGVDLPFVWKVALASALMVAVLILLVGFWNRRLRHEVDRRTLAEQTLARRNHVLEQISKHQPLSRILEDLVRSAEAQHPGTICSVLLLDGSGKRLHRGVAPSLPECFSRAVEGLIIGDGVGSCGHAAFTGSRVIVEDIRTHPYWADFQDLVARTDLRACWSQPIRSSSGDVLGTVALYHRQPAHPGEAELQLIDELATQAAIAIEHVAVADSLRKLSLAVEHSPNAVLVTDRDGIIEYANPRFAELSGFPTDQVVGKTPLFLRPDEKEEQVVGGVWRAIQAGEGWSGEVQNRRRSGELYWIRELVSPITDGDGKTTHFVWLQEDVTEARTSHEKIAYQANHDALTGLLNRYEFDRRLARAVEQAATESTEHAVCFLDLDQFKVVNDTVGHVAGDELLRQLGALLRAQLRSGDSLARLGGDEFAVLMEDCPLEVARSKMDLARKALEEFRFSWSDRVFTVGASFGLAAINADSGTSSDVLRHADIACYAAKDAGRNRIHVYMADDDILQERSGQMLWATRTTRALETDGFVLYAQPVVPVRGNATPAMHEILVRMLDADGQLLLPGAFLPSAERFGLASRIDRWVIDYLFRWLRSNDRYLNPRSRFTINLSGASVGDSELLAHLVDCFESGGIQGDRVEFEVTETVAIANLSAANEFIGALRRFGVRFALDDFGSGLSSFAYLKTLDVDYLKIDGMFVRDILTDPIDAAMVKSINEIGHVMGKKTIAEFVENHDILRELDRIGVDYAQGYGIGRPVPLDDLLLVEERLAV